ncbi:MAG: tRNA pseudouridine(38-40) synthase TruA [Bacteroidia bacterium]
MRYFIELSYSGTAYHGWQIQDNTFATIQQTINEMLSRLLNEPVFITGCGRTDTGVHAKQYYAHFDTTNINLIEEEKRWLFKFNNALPVDIAIYKIIEVKENANARFDAISRTYQYYINNKKNPFLINRSYFLFFDLDVNEMNNASKILFDYTDFSSFAKTNTQNYTNNCKIYKAEWRVDNHQLIFTISADRFLRNMVRAVVGTLLSVGRGKLTIEDFKKVIETKSRSAAGLSVPADGLYLTEVVYPANYFI